MKFQIGQKISARNLSEVTCLGLSSLVFLGDSLIQKGYGADSEWTASVEVKCKDANTSYSDINYFGARANASRGYDYGIDLTDPPANPTGINIFQEPDTYMDYLTGNYIGLGDTNRLFRGGLINLGGFSPTNVVFNFNNLPSNYRGMLFTFSDALYTTRNGTYGVTNGQDIVVPSNTQSYFITEYPKVTELKVTNNSQRVSGKISASFYTDDIPFTISVYSTGHAFKPLTNYFTLTNQSPGNFKGYFTNSSDQTKLFKLKAVN